MLLPLRLLKLGMGSHMRRNRIRCLASCLAALLVVPALVLSTAACAPRASGTTDVILASTTSTQDSGLFDVLIPAFESSRPEFKMKVVAVGSGEAIELGRNKDADVLLVHSPSAESSFVTAGYGTGREAVMYNDFVIVGPASDPAAIQGGTSAADAFSRIAKNRSPFVSRGDNSGTYTKELSVWKSSAVDPKGAAWYLSTGQGMGETLKIANEKLGYTLVDRATWLTNVEQNPDLELLVEGDKDLFNPYHVILIPGARNEAGAKAFAEWLVSVEGQKVIGDFGVSRYGEQIFVPNAGSGS